MIHLASLLQRALKRYSAKNRRAAAEVRKNIRLLNSRSSIDRRQAISKLLQAGRQGNPYAQRAGRSLIHLFLKDENYFVRIDAANALGGLYVQDAVVPLIEGFKNHRMSNDYRRAALEALTRLRDPRLYEVLEGAIRTNTFMEIALPELINLQDSRAVPLLLELLRSTKDTSIKFKIIDGLRRFGPRVDSVNALISSLYDTHGDFRSNRETVGGDSHSTKVRWRALHVLAVFKSRDAIQPIVNILTSKLSTAMDKRAAAWGLLEIDAKNSIQYVVDWLNELEEKTIAVLSPSLGNEAGGRCTKLLIAAAELSGTRLIGKVTQMVKYYNQLFDRVAAVHLNDESDFNSIAIMFLKQAFNEDTAKEADIDTLSELSTLEFYYLRKYVFRTQDGDEYWPERKDCSELASLARAELSRRAASGP